MPILNQQIRILIIDDDEDDFLITSDYIQGISETNFSIQWCNQYQDALVRIGKKEADLYFVDYRLGAKTGLDLLKEAIQLKCEEPIILLTGKGNQKIDKEAMQVGAFDYLVKSELNTEKLERCIRYSLERAASVKALKDNERKYRSIFERSKDAVFITDSNLLFRDVNDATSVLLGYQKNDLIGLSLYELIAGDDLKKTIEAKLNSQGEVNDLEIVVYDNQNEKKICILSITRQQENTGEIYNQGIIHDITNLKRAEKVTLQAEKLAATGRLVRTLAHEVRNPLSNIQMSVEQLEHVGIGNDDKVFLEIIQRNGKRINDLITELLDSSRPTEMRFKVVDLKTILSATIQVALDRMVLKQIKIETHYPEDSCLVKADEEKLKIAFLNIIINATEAISSPDGKIIIILSIREYHYQVEIIDNGCGISQENLSRLFEPYFTSKRNGMGLGLASTLNIIKSHQAMVDVKSELEVGTRFVLTFPKINLEEEQ